MVERISPEKFRDKLDADENFHSIDTRSSEDFAQWHIEGAINFPHPKGEDLGPDKVDRFREIADVVRRIR